MTAHYADQVKGAAYEVYGQSAAKTAGALSSSTTGCRTRPRVLFPHVDGRVSTLFGSPHQLAMNYAFPLELSIAEGA